ncbi:MAG: TonB-dependent receptor [Betaproteobacteria bacterium]|nr:MAG: TonB-dependent receptor [Betaproteobacteria bacterium]
MVRNMGCAVALAMAVFPAYAQDSELSKLREALRQLQQQVQQLEKRLQDAEKTATQAESTATQAAQQAASRPQAENALNPGISAILNGVYANLQRDPNTYRINGFVPTLGEVSPGKRGLSLGESELGFSANIDPTFRGTLIASISPDDEIGVEEGYIQTLGLSNGFTIKAGRFFSAVGYQNQVHAHARDFTDAPLAMKAFLGGQLGEDGVQLKWVAPTSVYWDLGLELGQGRAFPATERNKNGIGSSNLFTHLGGDIGESTAWQAGLSYLRTSPQDRAYADVDSLGAGVTNSFTGRSRLWVVDGVLKWAPNGNPSYNNFKLQGEYFRRKENGALTYDTLAESLGTLTDTYDSRQSGWYLQGVYRFMPQWRVGYRYDQLNSGATTLGLVDTGALTAADFPVLGAYKPKRHTVMVDWSPSEFSRVRLQYARDYSRMGEPDNQVFLQYIVSLGAHGAHRF